MGKLVDLAQHMGAIADKRDGSLLKAYLGPIHNALSCYCLNSAGLAIGSSSKKKVRIVNDTYCLINGDIVKVAADTEVAFTATTDDITDAYCRVYLITVDGAGTTALVKSAEVSGADLSACTLPVYSDNLAVIGMVGISVSGAIFNATSDDLDAGHITDTYFNITGPFITK